MSYRAGSKICRTDSVEESEFKASMAQIALFQAHIKHFTRVIALIDYATAHRVLGDVHHLYPLAFATGISMGSTWTPSRMTMPEPLRGESWTT